MAYRQCERRQQMMFPPSLDEYIEPDDPVRLYDAFGDTLDLDALGIVSTPQQRGCPAYPPRTMLKILVYGYSYGIRSSRKLERALYHNLSFLWLAGGLKPDFKTISRFRRDHRPALRQVLRHCARLCLKLGVVSGNTLFVDGTKLRAQAALDQTLTPEQCQERLEQIDQRIEQILTECEAIDAQEADQGSLAKLQKDLAGARGRKARIEAALETLRAESRAHVNITDPDCGRMHGRQGTHAGYNAQIVVDNEQGLIVQADVVSDNHDYQQFTEQITAVQELTGQRPEVAGADGGYYNGKKIEQMVTVARQVLVPARGQRRRPASKPFAKARFVYLASEDVYVCPAGQRLTCRRRCPDRGWREYQLDGGTCRACEHYRVCTKGRNGRRVIRYFNEDLRDRLREQFERPECQAVYARRQQTVELPFGHIKRNLGVDSFLLRGLAGVRAEMSLLASCFNLVRLMGIFGVRNLIGKLATL
jgi:transposase